MLGHEGTLSGLVLGPDILEILQQARLLRSTPSPHTLPSHAHSQFCLPPAAIYRCLPGDFQEFRILLYRFSKRDPQNARDPTSTCTG